MPGLSSRDLAGVEQIRKQLEVFQIGRPLPLDELIDDIRDLLQADAGLCYRAVSQLDFLAAKGLDSKALKVQLRALGEPRTWSSYDPTNPPIEQRNRLFYPMSMFPKKQLAAVPLIVSVFPKYDLMSKDQLRVLVCDGSTLLTWLGAFREKRFGRREEQILRQLIDPFKKRLILEKQLDDSSLFAVGLSAALEAIPTVALLLSAEGAIRFANSAGRFLADANRRQLAREMEHSIKHPGPHAPFSVTQVVSNGQPAHLLLVRRAQTDQGALRVQHAAREWKLTPRQTQVLGLIVRGYGNKTIAETLRCSLHTVELHVSAILKKAAVDSRTAVVSKVWQTQDSQ